MRLDDVLRPKNETTAEEATSEDPTPGLPDERFVTASTNAAPPANAALHHDRFLPVEAGLTVHPTETRESRLPSAPSRTPARDMAFHALGWHSTVPSQAKRPLWQSMPTFNQFLTISGAACLLLVLARVAGPPLAESARRAYSPYTAAGKQEICVTRLRSMALALAAYSQDNDGRYPPLDYQNPQGKRSTWVSLLKGRTAADNLICPVGPALPGGPESLTASFVLNPVVATARASDMDDPAATLLLADGGPKHDVSLLPPYPTWPSYGARRGDGGLEATECNFDFRHTGQAGVVYADGHAVSLSSGSGATDMAMWGGSAVLRSSRNRLSQRNAQAAEFFKLLQKDDISGAESYLKSRRTALKTVSGDMMALWRLNKGEHTSDSVEKLGWNLAQAWRKVGDNTFKEQAEEEQSLRNRAEVQTVNGGEWEQRQVPGQPSIRCEAPSAWKPQEEREGQYRRLYLRSSSPAFYALLEVGNRKKYVTPQPINWDEDEEDFKRRYKKNYRRLNRAMTTLSGQPASVWEYEVEKPGLPRIHKRVVGYTDGWTTHVTSFSAPAKDWNLCKPIFDRLFGSVVTGYWSE